MTKIEIKDLSILFGPEKAKAKKMIKQGKSKQEILKETGCTIAVRNANLEIKEGETTPDGLFSLDCLRCVGDNGALR